MRASENKKWIQVLSRLLACAQDNQIPHSCHIYVDIDQFVTANIIIKIEKKSIKHEKNQS